MVRFIGLDVHKRVVQVCLLDAAGQPLGQQRFALSRAALLDFARTQLQPDDRLVLEATTHTWALVGLLRPFVAELAVSNPQQTRAIAQAKVKTGAKGQRSGRRWWRRGRVPKTWPGRSSGPSGTYLFELAAQPGGPFGCSDTTGSS